jgi:hypothetical protein
MLEEVETDDISSEFSMEDDEEPIELDRTFTKDAPFPGSVKIIVQNTTFWFVHLSSYISMDAIYFPPLHLAGLTKRFSSSPPPSSKQL